MTLSLGAKIGLGALGFAAACGLSVGLYSWVKRPKPPAVTIQHDEEIRRKTKQEYQARLEAKEDEKRTLKEQLAQAERIAKNVQTRTVREVINFTPGAGPTTGAAPTVVLLPDGTPAPAPALTPGQIASIVRTTVDRIDRTAIDRTANADRTSTSDRTASSAADIKGSAATDDMLKSSTKITVGGDGDGGSSDGHRRLGVTIGADLKPGLSYDLVAGKVDLFGKRLGRYGAGPYIQSEIRLSELEKYQRFDIKKHLSGGLQGNLTPGNDRLGIQPYVQVVGPDPGQFGIRAVFKF